jgi:hypothetical protein
MKTPERIFIHKGFTSNTPESGSWHKDNITGEWIEYVRADIAKEEAERMAKEFAEYITGCVTACATVDELFEKFINSK